MAKSLTVGNLKFAAVALPVVAVIFLMANWQVVWICAAMLMAEHRPALLKDASWNDPASAARFHGKFHAGAPERDLLVWLNDNRFEVNGPARTARRSVHGLPCNEDIGVTWSSDASGRLTQANAVVTQIACL